jgi:cytochrome c-type biogenesis protein CcmH
MMFWVLAALMTAAVAAILLLPVTRRKKPDVSGRNFDAEIYRDQLTEIDNDIRTGQLSESEAETARAEVGRRLLKSSRSAQEAAAVRSGGSLLVRAMIILLLPVVALGGYIMIGYPGLSGQPLAARQNQDADNRDLASLVRQAEEHLAGNPDDGRGWDVLAPIYFRQGRMDDARIAYSNAIRLLGPTPARQAGLGQSLFALSGGIVTAEVQDAFMAVQKARPGEPFSAFILALGLVQDGRKEEAISAFRRILATSAPDAPWVPLINQHLTALGDAPAQDERIAKGPTREQVAAASEMSDEDRKAMITGMVESLDARLRDQPDDLDGWIKLVRSYMVLGRKQDAGDALDRALSAFDGQTEPTDRLMAVASQFGLSAGEKTQ